MSESRDIATLDAMRKFYGTTRFLDLVWRACFTGEPPKVIDHDAREPSRFAREVQAEEDRNAEALNAREEDALRAGEAEVSQQ